MRAWMCEFCAELDTSSYRFFRIIYSQLAVVSNSAWLPDLLAQFCNSKQTGLGLTKQKSILMYHRNKQTRGFSDPQLDVQHCEWRT